MTGLGTDPRPAQADEYQAYESFGKTGALLGMSAPVALGFKKLRPFTAAVQVGRREYAHA